MNFTIEDWMISKLKLKGYELLAFALIHSVTQGDGGCWYGGSKILAARIGATPRTAVDAVHSLMGKGLLRKDEAVISGRKTNILRSLVFDYMDIKKQEIPAGEEITEDVCKNFIGPMKKFHTSHEKISDNNLNNNIPPNTKESKDSLCLSPKRGKATRIPFIPPTIEQVEAYCREENLQMDPGEFVDHFTSNGWLVSGKAKMKDWKAAVRNWARRESSYNKPSSYQQQARPGVYAAPQKTVTPKSPEQIAVEAKALGESNPRNVLLAIKTIHGCDDERAKAALRAAGYVIP